MRMSKLGSHAGSSGVSLAIPELRFLVGGLAILGCVLVGRERKSWPWCANPERRGSVLKGRARPIWGAF